VEKLHGDPTVGPRSRPEVKNGSSAKDGAQERLRCGTIQEVSQILQRGVRRRCKKNSPSVLSCIGKRTREGYDRVATCFVWLTLLFN